MTLRLDAPAYEDLVAHAREGAPSEVCGVLAGRSGATAPGAARPAASRPEADGPATAAEDADPEGDGEPPERGSDRVTRALRATNVADDPRSRYELDPAEQLDLMREVEAAGEDVVGFYHSHPDGPARPSGTDERLATWEGYVYLVVSLADDAPSIGDGPSVDDGPSIGAWRWTGRRFVGEPVEIEE